MASKRKQEQTSQGLTIPRYYTREGVSPFDEFNYERRSSVIITPSGETVFELNDIEVPEHWS